MQPEIREDEVEIDLKELLFELLGHWKMIFLSMILVAAIAFAISKYVITPQYESTSELYVLSKSTSITSLADIQTGASLTNDYLVVAKGRPVIEQVIANLQKKGGEENFQETYESLVSKISITNPSDSRILQITVTDTNNDRAKDIADEMADVVRAYIGQKMDQEQPSIIAYGYSDWKRVSPSIAKNTVIGGMVGFILACAIIILTYMLNDSIMAPEDLEKKLDIHVLGTLPMEEDAEYDGEKKKRKKSRKSKR